MYSPLVYCIKSSWRSVSLVSDLPTRQMSRHEPAEEILTGCWTGPCMLPWQHSQSQDSINHACNVSETPAILLLKVNSVTPDTKPCGPCLSLTNA